jgi:hypothetical protein
MRPLQQIFIAAFLQKWGKNNRDIRKVMKPQHQNPELVQKLGDIKKNLKKT